MAELPVNAQFYILDKNFNVVHNLTQYESLIWVDRYDSPGDFEIYAPPTKEIIEAAQIGYYFKSTRSHHLMIIESLEYSFKPEDGRRVIIKGRSIESILDRRVLFLKLYLRNKDTAEEGDMGADNAEDAIRQVIDYTFMHPDDEDRKVSNLIFEYSGAPVNEVLLDDCEFEKGTNVLDVVESIAKQQNLGFQMTLNSSNQFVFKVILGKDHTYDQSDNPFVIFSPYFNNLKSSRFVFDYGENFKNLIYTEGEEYKNREPEIIKTGDATGLDRRELYVESNLTHETESSNVSHSGITKEKKTLTDDEYLEALKREGVESFEKYAYKLTMESEVEPRLQFQYGRDYGIGDIVQIDDGIGNTGKTRVTEFIISHSSSGYEEYPKFEDINEDSENPPQESI